MKRKSSATIIASVALLFSLAAGAQAQSRSIPTTREARHAIRAYDRADRPKVIAVVGCRHRDGAIVCHDTEYDVATDWTFDDRPIPMNITSRTVVRMRHNQPTVMSSYVTRFGRA